MKQLVKLLKSLLIFLLMDLSAGEDKETNLKQQIELNALYKKHLEKCELKLPSYNESLHSIQSQLHEKESKLKEKESKIRKLTTALKRRGASSLAGGCFEKTTATHNVVIPKLETMSVNCDSELAGPGYTVMLRRVNNKVSFDRDWKDYKAGFGDANENYFIGLEKLYLLTNSHPHKLVIYMKTMKGEVIYAKYSKFLIGDATSDYKLLSIGNFRGSYLFNAMNNHLNMKFSTRDKKNDLIQGGDCSKFWKSGWWYNDCYDCLFHGVYHRDEREIGLRWWNRTDWIYLKFVQMMIRPTFK